MRRERDIRRELAVVDHDTHALRQALDVRDHPNETAIRRRIRTLEQRAAQLRDELRHCDLGSEIVAVLDLGDDDNPLDLADLAASIRAKAAAR